MNIYVLSNEPWGDIWFSKHHYAHELSRMGHQVYFLDAPARWRPWHLFSFRMREQRLSEGLSVLRYENPLPMRLFPRLAGRLNDLLNSYKLRLHARSYQGLLWQFDPNRGVDWPAFGRGFRRIYHVADPYMTHPNDRLLAQRADVVVCTSPKYLQHYQSLTDRPVVYVPHGISEEEFCLDAARVEELRARHGDYVLLAGTINQDVDLQLLRAVARRGFRLLLVGKPEAVVAAQPPWAELLQEPGITYVGPVHAKDLKHYIAASRVCITAYHFDLRKVLGSRSPLKVLGYLAQGKPVVTSVDAEIPELEQVAIYRSHDQQGFLQTLERLFSQPAVAAPERVAGYLAQHRYPRLIASIFQKLQAHA